MPETMDDLSYDIKRPCNDCPFMKSSKFHEGVAESLPEYLESIKVGKFAHTCHKTDNRGAVDGPKNCKGPTQHCLGAILMLLKTSNQSKSNEGRGIWMQSGILHAMHTGKLPDGRFGELNRLSKKFNVFTLLELMDFYLRGIARLARKRDKKELRHDA